MLATIWVTIAAPDSPSGPPGELLGSCHSTYLPRSPHAAIPFLIGALPCCRSSSHTRRRMLRGSMSCAVQHRQRWRRRGVQRRAAEAEAEAARRAAQAEAEAVVRAVFATKEVLLTKEAKAQAKAHKAAAGRRCWNSSCRRSCHRHRRHRHHHRHRLCRQQHRCRSHHHRHRCRLSRLHLLRSPPRHRLRSPRCCHRHRTAVAAAAAAPANTWYHHHHR